MIESFGPLKQRLIFVSDGATRIRNWIKARFPEAASIVDFYHAGQYLYAFANKIYSQDAQQAKRWVEQQKELLPESKLAEVPENIKRLSPRSKATQKILKYYTDNKERMDYERYLFEHGSQNHRFKSH